MNPHIKRLLGEHEAEDGKLRPEAVMYLGPEQVNSDEGCRCGGCVFFDHAKAECHLTEPPACDAAHGVWLISTLPLTAIQHAAQDRVGTVLAQHVFGGIGLTSTLFQSPSSIEERGGWPLG